MLIYLGADHAGFELKENIKSFLARIGYKVHDEGAYQYEPDDDYPDYVKLVAIQVGSDPDSLGIIFGGSGQAEAITANRFKKVRAVVYYGSVLPQQVVDITGRTSASALEIIRLSREHNNANVLSIGARFVTKAEAEEAVKLWLDTPFTSDERHVRRLKKIDGLLKDENVF